MKKVGTGLLEAIPRTLTRNYGGVSRTFPQRVPRLHSLSPPPLLPSSLSTSKQSAGEAQSRQLALLNRSTRIAQGLEAFTNSTEEERSRILQTFALANEQTKERKLEYQLWTTRIWSKMSGKEKETKLREGLDDDGEDAKVRDEEEEGK